MSCQAAFRGATAAARLEEFKKAATLCERGLEADPASAELLKLAEVSADAMLWSVKKYVSKAFHLHVWIYWSLSHWQILDLPACLYYLGSVPDIRL